tara:strand:+ start:745 stop:1674 length:930 start_codon:yes stop_codon:yes gene_type:complete
MAEGAGPKIGDARSLWNFTPSPGWTKDEAYALRQCLKKFGIGKWVQIVDSGVLPGKQIQQLNGQTQRLLGIQSLAAYSGMKLDVDRIRMDNDALTDVTRKNGLITNQGGIRAKEALKELREENLKKYGLSEEEVEAIELPAPPRAAALGAQRYMGKNDIVPAEAKTIVKADATTLSPEGLNKSQKIAMLKALRSRVENLRVQLNEAATTAATTAENKAKKTPAAKRATKTPVKRGNKQEIQNRRQRRRRGVRNHRRRRERWSGGDADEHGICTKELPRCARHVRRRCSGVRRMAHDELRVKVAPARTVL